MKRVFILLMLSVFPLLTAFGYNGTAAATERLVNINQDWLYLENPVADVSAAAKHKDWVPVTLPHSWNSLDATDLQPGYRRSASWYRKNLSVENRSNDKRYFLYFEGANITTQVFVNGKAAGGHVGGYIGFEVEMTQFLKQGDNDILVRVDNSYDPEIIPSQKADFVIFGGITRDVWLKTVPNTFLKRVFVNPQNVSAKKADTELVVTLDNAAEAVVTGAALKYSIMAPDGKTVFTNTQKLTTGQLAQGQATLNFRNLKNPKLWSTDNPQLYQVQVQLVQNGAVSDVLTERYGYRWFEFKEHGPFFLNGKQLLLRGTHRHEEHAGYGAAVPNELHRKDVEQMKAMGVNFVRLAHYPQDPEVYKACDELGILVWDELPWCRGGIGNDPWKANTKRLLQEMITQNRNHPSIILWSLGNEMYWLPDFEDGGNTDKISSFLRELNAFAHQLDPSRKTAIRKYYAGSDIVDVFSPSIWSGWYSGIYQNYESTLRKSMQEYPRFLHAEYGGDSHVGRHTYNPITGEDFVNPEKFEEEVNQIEIKNIAQHGDWSESYIVDLFDWYLGITERLEGFVGNAQWVFKDFATPLRPENDIPYMNQKGLLDRSGRPKDAYYVFKSFWSDEPFNYIQSHTWTERYGKQGESKKQRVYSSCEEVEFFHNDESLGRKKKDKTVFPAAGLVWDVNFTEGKNQLVAVGYNKGRKATSDTLEVNFTYTKNGSPAELVLSSTKLENGNLLVQALALDAKGNRCLDYQGRVYFQSLQGGETMKSLGTPTGSASINMANGRAAIEVVPSLDDSDIIVEVRNQDFKGSYLTVKKEGRKGI